jgi:hypothetical protein
MRHDMRARIPLFMCLAACGGGDGAGAFDARPSGPVDAGAPDAIPATTGAIILLGGYSFAGAVAVGDGYIAVTPDGLVRIDTSGSVVWRRPGRGGERIQGLENGNLVMWDSAGFLRITDGEGALIEEKKIFKHYLGVRSIHVEADGSYVVVQPLADLKERVTKVNADGTVAWERDLDATWRFSSVTPAGDGGYVLNSLLFESDISSESCVSRLTPEGTIAWTRCDPRCFGNGRGAVLDDGYVFVGSQASTSSACAMKLDREGVVAWTRTYPSIGSGTRADLIRRVASGNFLVGGTGPGFDGAIVLLEITPAGDEIWSRAYAYPGRGVIASDLVESAGGYLVVGGLSGDQMTTFVRGALLPVDKTGMPLRTGSDPEYTPDAGVQPPPGPPVGRVRVYQDAVFAELYAGSQTRSIARVPEVPECVIHVLSQRATSLHGGALTVAGPIIGAPGAAPRPIFPLFQQGGYAYFGPTFPAHDDLLLEVSLAGASMFPAMPKTSLRPPGGTATITRPTVPTNGEGILYVPPGDPFVVTWIPPSQVEPEHEVFVSMYLSGARQPWSYDTARISCGFPAAAGTGAVPASVLARAKELVGTPAWGGFEIGFGDRAEVAAADASYVIEVCRNDTDPTKYFSFGVYVD